MSILQEVERKYLKNKKSPDELIDMIFELRNIISQVTHVNQEHCDLLAEYIVNYCKDKFDEAANKEA